MSSLQYRLAVGGGVPIILAVVGILGKKLARRESWKRSDFYPGVEFTLAGVSAALLNLFDLLLRPGRIPQASDNKMLLGNILVGFSGMFLFMFVISLHQDYADENNVDHDRNKELGMLAGVSNAIGFFVLMAGVVLMSV